MKVYISGPITYGGTQEVSKLTIEKFTQAAMFLESQGHAPVNPIELNQVYADRSWSACMRRDIQTLMDCDAIYLLRGWENSQGAQAEERIAAAVGIPRWYATISGMVAVVVQNTELNPRQLPFAPSPGSEHLIDGLQLPTRAHEGDAGFDLYVTEDAVINSYSFCDIHCNLSVEMPQGIWGLVIGRSSTLRKRGLMVNPGVIDTGYRGELFTGVFNLRPEPAVVEYGERLAQFILFNNVSDEFVPVMRETLSSSTRGTRGFGSSGK